MEGAGGGWGGSLGFLQVACKLSVDGSGRVISTPLHPPRSLPGGASVTNGAQTRRDVRRCGEVPRASPCHPNRAAQAPSPPARFPPT